jgi:uncharacterized repeat protein (TIGR03803 family)
VKNNERSIAWITIAILTSATLAYAPHATAQQERVLHTFTDRIGGLEPWGGLVFDKAGNIYGVTLEGGQFGDGTVFKLTIEANNVPVESVLHSFQLGGQDGLDPYEGPIFDASGNLYGTTYNGGNRPCTTYSGTHGCGTVYELIPQPDGTWTEQILHHFTGGDGDGANPYAGLVFDAAGNLYGTTYHGGNRKECGKAGCGTVFELSPDADGTWQEKIIFNFYPLAGTNPVAALTLDASGNLYGTTEYGGTGYNGTVFELTPPTSGETSGEWNETILHSFAFGTPDGADPESGVTFDSSGNLYGTTFLGGDQGYGTLYELTPSGGGTWTETILHNFQGNFSDAAQPGPDKLVFDSAGNLYGASGTGGSSFQGAVFQFSPSAGGGWTESILHSFAPGPGGYYPSSSVILDSAGDIYGTTGTYGGTNKSVYEIVRPR